MHAVLQTAWTGWDILELEVCCPHRIAASERSSSCCGHVVNHDHGDCHVVVATIVNGIICTGIRDDHPRQNHSSCQSAMAGVTWWNFYFRLFAGTIRSPQVIEFLSHVLRHIPGKLLIIWDGLTGHRSRMTWEFIRLQSGHTQ